MKMHPDPQQIAKWPWPDKPQLQRAVSRIGPKKSGGVAFDVWDPFRWEVLAYIVELAYCDLSALSAGQTQDLQEELTALTSVLSRNPQAPVFPLGELDSFMALAKKDLESLADSGFTKSTPIGLTYMHFRAPPGLPLTVKHPIRQHPQVVGWVTTPEGQAGLIYWHLWRLLERFPGIIRRCQYPKCHRPFAQYRRDSTHCSRECQNRHIMERLRAGKFRGKRGRPRKNVVIGPAASKGAEPAKGRKHGKTKR